MTPTDLETLRTAMRWLSTEEKAALTALLADYERMRKWIAWNPEYWRAYQDGFTGTLRQFQSGAKHMTTKTDEARECAEDCAADICHELNIDDNEFNIHNIADQIVKHFPPSVPDGWMRDEKQVKELAEHLENIGWQPDGHGEPDCVDQGAAMAAEVIRRVLLPLIAEAK